LAWGLHFLLLLLRLILFARFSALFLLLCVLLVQAGLPHVGASMRDRVAAQGGFKGLYRGCAPGVFGGGFRNACAMAAMANWQRLATHLGLRDEK
jgi:hypothetical protein